MEGNGTVKLFFILFLLLISFLLLANDMSQCVSLINEVIIEAEAFGDINTQAEMMMQAVILDLHERRPVADIKPRLQV